MGALLAFTASAGDAPEATKPGTVVVRILGGAGLADGADSGRGGAGAVAVEVWSADGRLGARGALDVGGHGATATAGVLWALVRSELVPFLLLEAGAAASSSTIDRSVLGVAAGLEGRMGAFRLGVEAHARAVKHEDDGTTSLDGSQFLLLAGVGFAF